MDHRIYPKEIDGNLYYYAQRSFRQKIDPLATGKTKGSGKSKVVTESIYLGTAAEIVQKMTEPTAPREVRYREFGFVAAIYQTAVEVGLVRLLQEQIPGARYGIPRWLYFLLTIINRLEQATSKEQMGKWAARTVLPTLLGFDPKRLDSQSFWYATDDIISEQKLRQRRKDDPHLCDDLFVGLDDGIFVTLEEQLVANLRTQFPFYGDLFLYDTTNFFTYIDEPVRSHLARTGHNKESHHHLRQVGLALCVDKEWGLPLFHRLYRGNAHDSKTFTAVVTELIAAMKAGCAQVDNLVLVLDKGNNSPENFAKLNNQLRWVGSLVPSHYADLMDLPLEVYHGFQDGYRYYQCQRQVMGIDCQLVITYNQKLAHKQEYSLQHGIEKLKETLREKGNSYKHPLATIPKGMLKLLKQSRSGDCLAVDCSHGTLTFSNTPETEAALHRKRKHFGKNLLFSSDLKADAGWIITQYHSKDKIENDFKLLKDPELIRWRPARHWTDTKIRAFGFCCVMALLLIRVMELKIELTGMRMSPAVFKQDLSDLKEILMLHDHNTAVTRISARSTNQQRLFDLFQLKTLENQLTGH